MKKRPGVYASSGSSFPFEVYKYTGALLLSWCSFVAHAVSLFFDDVRVHRKTGARGERESPVVEEKNLQTFFKWKPT